MIKTLRRLELAIVLACSLFAGIASASITASVAVTGSAIHINVSETLSNPSVRVSGPDGFYQTANGLVVYADGVIQDGQYSYEVSAELSETSVTTARDSGDNGRDSSNGQLQTPVGVVYSGFFIVSGGTVAAATEE